MTPFKPVRVYLDVLPWDCRARNTDWKYVRFGMPHVADWEPEIDLVLQRSRFITVRGNLKAVRQALGNRVGLPIGVRAFETDRIDAREFANSGCDIIFTHRGLPLNAGTAPVIWMNAIVDPVMTAHYFRPTPAAVQAELEVKSELYAKVAAVQVCTEVEAKRHAATFPGIADRFVPIPLFAPHLEACPQEMLAKHHNAAPVRILFVGNDARRKALPETLDAYMQLPKTVRNRTELRIISSFDHGEVPIPSDDRITVFRGLPQAAVMDEMRKAHILVNVAHFESFGFVFLEAMSQGTVCIGPDWEVQREIFDYGRAGMNVPPQANPIREALERVIEDDAFRLTLAEAGWSRFRERYSPTVTARQYADLFRTVANQ